MFGKQSIHLLIFPSAYQCNATFLRFQEHYESPKFAGKIFDWEEYMDWCAEQRGNFTYFEDWSGFNLPGRVLEVFYAGKFDPLTRKERALLDIFENVKGNFYVIGTYREDGLWTIRHEIIRGLFYLFPDYRRAVREAISGCDTSAIKEILLGSCGYSRKVLVDEINAYLTSSRGRPVINSKKLPAYKKLKQSLKNLFRESFGFSPDCNNEYRWLEFVQVHRIPPLRTK